MRFVTWWNVCRLCKAFAHGKDIQNRTIHSYEVNKASMNTSHFICQSIIAALRNLKLLPEQRIAVARRQLQPKRPCCQSNREMVPNAQLETKTCGVSSKTAGNRHFVKDVSCRLMTIFSKNTFANFTSEAASFRFIIRNRSGRDVLCLFRLHASLKWSSKSFRISKPKMTFELDTLPCRKIR